MVRARGILEHIVFRDCGDHAPDDYDDINSMIGLLIPELCTLSDLFLVRCSKSHDNAEWEGVILILRRIIQTGLRCHIS